MPGLSAIPQGIRDKTIPATVPGCVHTDLLNAGLIGHPNTGFHENEIQWIGETDWRYVCRFFVEAAFLQHECIDLACDGLDTIAELELNGRRIGQTANMHHPHRFDARAALRAGANELHIVFRAPRRYIQEEEHRLGARPVNGDWEPYIFMRKAACNFGWDWGPHVATVGIWRGVELQGWNTARIEQVRPLVRRLDDENWLVDVQVALMGAKTETNGKTIRACAELAELHDGSTVLAMETQPIAANQTEAALSLRVKNPALWWPRGHGAQPLYTLKIRLQSEPLDPAAAVNNMAAAETLDHWTGRIGFRTVRLNTKPDERGSIFALEINGRPIFCKGANWIPDGLFPADMTPRRCRARVRQAADANMNMLRVWGGGLYESPAFYETCDELGLLIWQDFMFACALYPEEPPFPDLVRMEARHNIARLSRHPSVVLWCGGNECLWAYASWGFKERLKPGQTWGHGYYFDQLPRLVAELDPTRPYWPNSPWSDAPDLHPNDPRHGSQHVWDARVEGYRTLVPPFVGEFGHQSPPNYATLRAALPESELQIDSAAMRHRQRASDGNAARYDEPLREWFREPKNFDEWHYLAQLLQARAVSIGIEWWRANTPPCMGALFWQLNDCWAGHSWSAIDCAGRRKPLWYAVRRSFAPRLLTIQPVNGQPALFAINETDIAWRGLARVRRMKFDGTILATEEHPLKAGPWSSCHFPRLLESAGTPTERHGELLVADADGLRALWFYERDRDLTHPAPRFQASLTRNEGGYALKLQAETLLRDIVLAADRLDADAALDEQLVTLLPGETHVFQIFSRRELSLEQLLAPPVFQCANPFSG